MNTGNVRTQFVKYVSMNMLGMIGLSCYILADTFFCARALGNAGLTALNLAISVYSLIHAAGLMLGIGGATRYTVLQSQNQRAEADRVFSNIVVLALIVGGILFVTGLFGSSHIAALLGAKDSILPMTSVYLKVILCFAPCFIMNNVLLAFVRNDRSPDLSMAAMLTGSFSNIVLDYVFMFPLGMGMFGAAFATGLAPVISMAVLSLHFLRGKNQFRFVWGKLQGRRVYMALASGLSAFVTETASGIVLIVFNLVILNIEGNLGVAAYGIVANIALVVLSVFNGIAQGMQPLVSRCYGNGDRKTMHLLKRDGFLLALILAGVIYCGIFAFSDQVISVFNREESRQMAEIARNGLRIYFIGFFFAGINVVSAAFYSAAAQPGKGFLISLTRGFLAILPLVLILPAIWGMEGVWLAFVFAEAISLLPSLARKRVKK